MGIVLRITNAGLGLAAACFSCLVFLTWLRIRVPRLVLKPLHWLRLGQRYDL